MGLAEAVSKLVRSLPRDQIETLAVAIEASENPHEARKNGASGLVPTPGFAFEAGRLLAAWEGTNGITGAGVATALRAASSAANESNDNEGEIEVVWTGPSAHGMPVRLTSAVIHEVAGLARSRLFLVSYAAYKVPAVLSAIEQACDRNVDVRLVLETERGSKGKLKFDAKKAFGDLVDRVTIWQWDPDKRPELKRGSAVLHAKAAVADDHTAFVTSANLTGLGLDQNLELGLLVRHGSAPAEIARYLVTLMDEEILTLVS